MNWSLYNFLVHRLNKISVRCVYVKIRNCLGSNWFLNYGTNKFYSVNNNLEWMILIWKLNDNYGKIRITINFLLIKIIKILDLLL